MLEYFINENIKSFTLTSSCWGFIEWRRNISRKGEEKNLHRRKTRYPPNKATKRKTIVDSKFLSISLRNGYKGVFL